MVLRGGDSPSPRHQPCEGSRVVSAIRHPDVSSGAGIHGARSSRGSGQASVCQASVPCISAHRPPGSAFNTPKP